MKEYYITMPIAGAITLCVTAENEQQAKDMFYDSFADVNIINHFGDNGLSSIGAECVELEFYESMGQGNVRHYTYDRMDIEENDSSED